LKKREGDLLEREMVFGVKRVIMIVIIINKENSSIQCMFCNLLTLVQIFRSQNNYAFAGMCITKVA